MTQRDPLYLVKPMTLLAASAGGAQTTASIDMSTCEYVLISLTIALAASGFAYTIEESDDDVTFTDAGVGESGIGTPGIKYLLLHRSRFKRYIRLVSAGTATAVACDCALLGLRDPATVDLDAYDIVVAKN